VTRQDGNEFIAIFLLVVNESATAYTGWLQTFLYEKVTHSHDSDYFHTVWLYKM